MLFSAFFQKKVRRERERADRAIFIRYPLDLLLAQFTVRCKKKKNFRPSRCTGRWKFATNGGSSQHFYKRLNALKSARIERREDSKRHSVAKIGKNGYFFVKRARRFRNAEGAQDPFRVLYVLGHPKWENLGLQRARFIKK